MTSNKGVYASDHSDSVLRGHSRRTAEDSLAYLLSEIQPNMKILDIGCGPGSITVDLAKRIPQGHIIGIDYTEEPLVQARALAISQDVTNIDFQIGDIHDLPFKDETFDIVNAHQVLQHIRNPVQAIKEMKRVAKKGGLVAVRESASMIWYPQTPELAEWKDLHTRVSTTKGGNPDPGSYIHVWAGEAGFERADILCSAGAWCYSTKEEIAWWSELWVDRLTQTSFAKFAVDGGHCTQDHLQWLADGWRKWGKDENARFSILHGEIICKV